MSKDTPMVDVEDDVKRNIEHRETQNQGLMIEGMSPNQILDAYHAALSEHRLPVKDSFRIYTKSILWITVFGMDQFDTNTTNSLQAFASFQKQFGHKVPGKKNAYQLYPWQQTTISNVGLTGHICGLLINGYIVDKVGNRRCILFALGLIMANTFLLFFAQNFAMIVAGSFIQRGTAGFIGTIAPAYAIEFAPLALRPYAPVYVHFCEVFGNLIGSGVGRRFASGTTQWAWRIPFAIQWSFPIPLIIAMIFAPESPWWDVRKGNHDRALKTLTRLNNGEADDEGTLALMQHTVQLERALKFGGTYWHLFKGVNLRRTEISFMACVAQSLCGFGLTSTAYLFEAAGLSNDEAFSLQIGQFALGIFSTGLAMLLLKRIGRRPLWMIGTTAMAFLLALTGSLALVPNQTPAIVWPQGVFVLVHFFFNNLSVGPLSFLLSTEIGSVQLRRKTIAFGRCGFDAAAMVSGAVAPYLINPTAANLRGREAWIPCGFNIMLLIYGFFRLPETKDRNSEELDILFANKIPARKFKRYVISSEQEFGVKEDEKGQVVEQVNPTVTEPVEAHAELA